MKFLKNLNLVSEILFLILGGLYLLAFVFFRNNVFSFYAEYFLRLADIPFALVCIIFAASSMRISFTYQYTEGEVDEKSDELVEAPILDAILILLSLILFLTVVFLNFAISDLI